MTVIRSGGDASWEDTEALKALDQNDDERLEIARARSEKWLGGLAALTGLLSTVLILKGPDTASELPLAWRIVVASLIAIALGALAFGTYRAYQSAYGDPGRLSAIDRSPVKGLATRLRDARRADAIQSQHYLRQALVATFVGAALLAVATGITWFTHAATQAESTSTCLFVDRKLVAKFASSTAILNLTSDGVTVSPCS